MKIIIFDHQLERKAEKEARTHWQCVTLRSMSMSGARLIITRLARAVHRFSARTLFSTTGGKAG